MEHRCEACGPRSLLLRRGREYSLAKSLRDVFGEHIRLIAVTSRDAPEERDRSREAGFDTYLVKPVSPNRVHQTLRQRRAH